MSPEFKKFADDYVAVCDELVAVVDKAEAANSYAAVEDEWKSISDKLDKLSSEERKYAEIDSNGEHSDADKAYYNKVLLPAATKSANAASRMLKLI